MNIKRDTSGFTLFEMTIVVAMISILAAIVVIQFSQASDPVELDNAEAVVAADIRQMIALSQQGAIEPTTGTVPKGYGVIFLQGSSAYQLYAEYDGNDRYDTDPSSSDVIIDEIDLQTDELISSVQISGCSPTELIGSQMGCDMFVSHPETHIYVNGARSQDLAVTVQHTDSFDTRTVQVDYISGKVE